MKLEIYRYIFEKF